MRFGFITHEHLEEALAEQRRRDLAGRTHPLIGMLLVEMHYLTTTQLLTVLKTSEETRESSGS